jgi:pimeloyl-ACP methyl ester carboxylesterase
MTETYVAAPTRVVTAENGINYAYRQLGEGSVPVVLFQHFRGNLDNWDPALIEALAATRPVITFDNVGVGSTTGTTPSTIAQMASDALAFLDALQYDGVDVLGFSIGSFIAQEMALTRPASIRKLVLASSAPQGADGMHGWSPEVIDAVGKPEPDPDGYLRVFFTDSASSREAGQQALQRIFSRAEGRDDTTTWQTRLAQYDAVAPGVCRTTLCYSV